MSGRAFARLLGITHTRLQQVAAGQRPSVDLAYRIERLTNGLVKAGTLLRPNPRSRLSQRMSERAEGA